MITIVDLIKGILLGLAVVALIAGVYYQGVDQGKEQTWQEVYSQADISMTLRADDDGRVWCEETGESDE